jgi:hypothetical protein
VWKNCQNLRNFAEGLRWVRGRVSLDIRTAPTVGYLRKRLVPDVRQGEFIVDPVLLRFSCRSQVPAPTIRLIPKPASQKELRALRLLGFVAGKFFVTATHVDQKLAQLHL